MLNFESFSKNYQKPLKRHNLGWPEVRNIKKKKKKKKLKTENFFSKKSETGKVHFNKNLNTEQLSLTHKDSASRCYCKNLRQYG